MNKVRITEVKPERFEAKIGNWSSGIGKMRTINRRVEAHKRELAEIEARKKEALRYEDAPKKACPRCNGTGHISHYSHIAHGICFKCGGSGKVEVKE